MTPVYGHTVHTLRFSTNIEAFQTIAENKDLSKKDLRIFMFLCCRLQSKFYSKIEFKQIATTLDLSPGDVKDSIEKLLYERIITKGGDEHITKGYRFSYSE